MTRRLAFALVALYLAPAAMAADATIDGVRLGKMISGDKVSVDDLKGRVVFVEKWGIH